MPTRTKSQNTLSHGDWNVLCQVCGFKFKSCDLKKRWDGLYVCKDDYEARHPSDFFRVPKEDESIPFVRSDKPVTGGVDVNGNPFPPVLPYFINLVYEILAGTPAPPVSPPTVAGIIVDPGTGEYITDPVGGDFIKDVV